MTDEIKKLDKDFVPSTESERIAVSAARLVFNESMNELFATFGVERGNFRSMEEFKSDIRFLRSLRKRKDIWNDLDFVATLRQGSLTAGKRFGFALVVIMAGSFAVGLGTVLKEWLVFIVTGKH